MSIEKNVQKLQNQFDDLLKEAAQNEVKLKKFQAFELDLMNASSLIDLIKILLKKSQVEFGWKMVNLILVDPQYEIQRLLGCSGKALSEYPELLFVDNSEELEENYEQLLLPIIEIYSDDAHYPLFSSKVTKPDYIWSIPLSRDNHLIGCYNIGKQLDDHSNKKPATDFLQHLAAVISVCLEISITREKLQHLGLTDPLTGINNRRFFDQRLIEEVTTVIRENTEISCLFIDIDHFKSINDKYGHQVGDYILKEVAKIIRQLLRSTDIVARYGGEEFTVLLAHKGKQKAIEIAERIRKTIEKQAFTIVKNEDIAITTSIGINTFNPDKCKNNIHEVASLFVEHADLALYKAKNNGRNRVEFYNSDK